LPRSRSVRRLWLFFLLALIGLAGLLADGFTLGPFLQPALLPPVSPHTLPHTDLNPYGVNIFLDKEVEDWKKRRTMEMIAAAGIGWVRQQFSWAEIEPRPGDFWDSRYNKSSWEKFDRIVELAEEYGLQVIARVDRPPAWARPAGSNPQAPPSDPRTYADFIGEFVRHYRGRIHYIQVWNEPNLHTEWRQGAPVDARAYVTLLRMAYESAKRADPDVQILCAPLAVNNVDDPNRLFLSELTYLEEMYQAGVAPYCDIMSANAYGFNDPPESPPDPNRFNFRRVELLRLIMEKYGDQDKPIWFNEYGWNAAPPDIPAEKLIWGRVSEEEQARWTVEGIRYAREHWPWAGVMTIWYFRQVGDIPPDSAEYYFRMVNVDFTPTPLYEAVRRATTSLGTASPGRYEETAAPLRRQGNWNPLHNPSCSARSCLAGDTPGSRLVLTFLGTDLTLRLRRGPDGGRLLVTVDGVSGQGTSLPRNSFGLAYLDLYSPAEEWVEIPLLQGLGEQFPPQEHRLELVIAEEKSPASEGHLCVLDGFSVGIRRSYLLFGALAGLSLGLSGIAGVEFLRELRRPPAPRLRPVPVNPWTYRCPAPSSQEQAEPPGQEPPSSPSEPS